MRYLIAAVAALLILGCGGSGNPVQPDDTNDPSTPDPNAPFDHSAWDRLLGTWTFGFYAGDKDVDWPKEPFRMTITWSDEMYENDHTCKIIIPQILLDITGDPGGFYIEGYTQILSRRKWCGGGFDSTTAPFTLHYHYYSFSWRDDGKLLLGVGIPNDSPGIGGRGNGGDFARYVGAKL